jgi:hypothetical protein
MRITPAQRYLTLAIIAPIAVAVLCFAFLELGVAIRGDRWPHDSIVPDVSWGLAAFMALWSFAVFATLALTSATPRGPWAREAQHVLMNVLVYGLLIQSMVALFAIVTWETPIFGTALLPALPLGLMLAYRTHARDNRQATPRRFLQGVGVFVLVVAAAVAIVSAIGLSAALLGGPTVATIVSAIVGSVWLVTFLFGAIAIFVNWPLRWWFKLRTGRPAAFCCTFFFRTHRWRPMGGMWRRNGGEACTAIRSVQN